MTAHGQAFVRVAQLRGRIATFARARRYDHALELLGELVRADLGLDLPADALLRARQAAELAAARDEPIAGPLIVLAAALLAAEAFGEAIEAAAAASARARENEHARIEVMASLVAGGAQRRLGRDGEARRSLETARATAARLGESALAGLALAELAWLDLAEDHPAAAATCFEVAGELLRRARHASSVECDALAVACWAATDDLARATDRAAIAADAARDAGRRELVAYIDGILAELALRAAPEAAPEACALAAESAHANRPSPGAPSREREVARELIARARLRQVRVTADRAGRAHHLEAGIELALALAPARSGARLGGLMFDLVADAERAGTPPAREELDRLAAAIGRLHDDELAEMASAVLAELG